MSSFKDFIGNIRQRGLALNNRFEITFGLPQALKQAINNPSGGDSFQEQILQIASDIGGDPTRPLSIMCTSVPIVGTNITTNEIRMGTYSRKAPVSRQFGDFDVMFTSSGDMVEKKALDAWQHMIFDKNNVANFYDEVVADITVKVLDNSGNPIYGITLLECFPTIITPITLDRSGQSDKQQFQVTFVYWKASETTGVENREYKPVDRTFPTSQPSRIPPKPSEHLNYNINNEVNFPTLVGQLDPLSASIVRQFNDITEKSDPNDDLPSNIYLLRNLLNSVRRNDSNNVELIQQLESALSLMERSL